MRAFLYRCAVAGLIATAVIAGAVGAAEALTRTQRLLLFGLPSWLPRTGVGTPTLYVDFANGRYWYQGNRGSLSAWLAALGGTFTRADSPSGIATDLLPSAAAGAPYHTYAANVPRLVAGSGYLAEQQRTNLFVNSTAPATQTINFTATGGYYLWVNGSGSIAMSAGTATGCGTGTATNGSPVAFFISATGTCVFTVAGTPNFAQVEAGSAPSSGIVTTGAAATRAADLLQIPLGTWWNQSAGSVATNAMTTLFSANIFHADGTGSSRIDMTFDTSGVIRDTVVANSGTLQYDTGTNLTSFSRGSFYRNAFAWRANDYASYDSGGRSFLQTGSGATLPTPTRINIGGQGAAATVTGFVAQFAYWPARVPNADLQRLTK